MSEVEGAVEVVKKSRTSRAKVEVQPAQSAVTEPLALTVAKPKTVALRPIAPSTLKLLPTSNLPNGRPIEASLYPIATDLPTENGRPIFKSTLKLLDYTLMTQRPIEASSGPIAPRAPQPEEGSTEMGLALRPSTPVGIQLLPSNLPNGRPVEASSLVVAHSLLGNNNRPVFKDIIQFQGPSANANRPLGVSPVPLQPDSPLPNHRPIFSNEIPGDDLITYD